MASAIGPLKTYEANLREADTTLLWADNNSFVPSIDTIRTVQSNFNRDHRLDNDPIKELAIGQYVFISSDVVSSKMRGMRSIFSWKFHFVFVILYAQVLCTPFNTYHSALIVYQKFFLNVSLDIADTP